MAWLAAAAPWRRQAAAAAAAGGGLAWARRRYTTDAAEALLHGKLWYTATLQPRPCYTTTSQSTSITRTAEYEAGRPPQVVPFEIGEEEARRKFLSWQAGRARLAPSGLLAPGGPWRMRAALLPFWLCDVRARVEYAGSVGTADK